MTNKEPDRNPVEVQRKRLDLQTTSGGAMAEKLYVEAYRKYREEWNATPGNERLL